MEGRGGRSSCAAVTRADDLPTVVGWVGGGLLGRKQPSSSMGRHGRVSPRPAQVSADLGRPGCDIHLVMKRTSVTAR